MGHEHPWTFEDTWTLVLLVSEHGRKWRLVARSFPSRSASSVRNHWLRMEARSARALARERAAEDLPAIARVDTEAGPAAW